MGNIGEREYWSSNVSPGDGSRSIMARSTSSGSGMSAAESPELLVTGPSPVSIGYVFRSSRERLTNIRK